MLSRQHNRFLHTTWISRIRILFTRYRETTVGTCFALALHLLCTCFALALHVAFVLHAKVTSLNLGLVEQTIEHIDFINNKGLVWYVDM